MTVVALPGAIIEGPEPRRNVVELIEELLAEAKTGKIQSFGAFAVDARGAIGTCWAKGGMPHAHHMVAGSLYLLRRAEASVLVERDEGTR